MTKPTIASLTQDLEKAQARIEELIEDAASWQKKYEKIRLEVIELRSMIMTIARRLLDLGGFAWALLPKDIKAWAKEYILPHAKP